MSGQYGEQNGDVSGDASGNVSGEASGGERGDGRPPMVDVEMTNVEMRSRGGRIVVRSASPIISQLPATNRLPTPRTSPGPGTMPWRLTPRSERYANMEADAQGELGSTATRPGGELADGSSSTRSGGRRRACEDATSPSGQVLSDHI